MELQQLQLVSKLQPVSLITLPPLHLFIKTNAPPECIVLLVERQETAMMFSRLVQTPSFAHQQLSDLTLWVSLLEIVERAQLVSTVAPKHQFPLFAQEDFTVPQTLSVQLPVQSVLLVLVKV